MVKRKRKQNLKTLCEKARVLGRRIDNLGAVDWKKKDELFVELRGLYSQCTVGQQKKLKKCFDAGFSEIEEEDAEL